ncbi:MAG: peptidase M48 [Deltaproteobacteria bacterium]|nr:MAG: peptidase M48 [Deltaproteobacteria bacterium]
MRRIRKTKLHPYLCLFVLLLIAACATVPLTGRSQLNLIPASSMRAMSLSQYTAFLTKNPPAKTGEDARMVKRVGTRIQKAVETYFEQNGRSAELSGYAWEFNLVESETVNAWCMPGGKVVVYSGILPIAENETGLAVVMGHEIAHAVARHGNERMSQALMVQLGGIGLSVALEEQPEKTQALWMTAFGVATQVGLMLPFSRLHEKEADHLGLIFMSMAGYDPRQAVGFWQRMSAQGGGGVPEFLSTHPSDETRVRNLQTLVPEALTYYRNR